MGRQHVINAALVVGMLFLASAYAIAFFAPATGLFHDDGIYLVTARALAEGQGYRIISLPQAPPQTKYPILFPWLLSLTWRLAPSFPDNVLLLRIVPLASAIVWLWLSWRLLLSCGATRGAATVVVALIATSPWVVFLGTALLSETLFAALLTGSLLLLTQTRAGSVPIGRTCTIAGLLAGACFLTRTAGLAVVLAGFAWLVVNRRRAGALAYGAAAAALMIPWAWWVQSNAGADAESYYSASSYQSWNVVFHYSWPEKFAVVATNAVQSILAPLALWGIDMGAWFAVPAALLAACACRGVWLTRTHPVSWCVIAYMGTILLWLWPPARFLVPVLPLLLWQSWVAIRGAPKLLVAAVATLLLATSSSALVQAAAHARASGLMWPRAEYAEDWHQLSTLFEWIRRETPPNVVLTGNLDPTYFLYTGRKSVRAFVVDPYVLYYSDNRMTSRPLGSVSDFGRRLLDSGADYCVWSPGPAFGESPHFRRLLDDLSREVPGALTIASGDEVTGYVVYRIDRLRLAAATQP
jgi:hypothetical protein